jgi:hypothetical protein
MPVFTDSVHEKGWSRLKVILSGERFLTKGQPSFDAIIMPYSRMDRGSGRGDICHEYRIKYPYASGEERQDFILWYKNVILHKKRTKMCRKVVS